MVAVLRTVVFSPQVSKNFHSVDFGRWTSVRRYNSPLSEFSSNRRNFSGLWCVCGSLNVRFLRSQLSLPAEPWTCAESGATHTRGLVLVNFQFWNNPPYPLRRSHLDKSARSTLYGMLIFFFRFCGPIHLLWFTIAAATVLLAKNSTTTILACNAAQARR